MAAAIGRRAGFADFAMDRIQATVDSHMQQSLLSLNKGGTPVRCDSTPDSFLISCAGFSSASLPAFVLFQITHCVNTTTTPAFWPAERKDVRF